MRLPGKDIDRLSKLLVKSAFEKTPEEKKDLFKLWSRLRPADRIYTLPHDLVKQFLKTKPLDRSDNDWRR
jgi:hypothetical protein